MRRIPTWYFRRTRRGKNARVEEHGEQGKRWDCKCRKILQKTIQAKVRHLDMILTVLETTEGKN